MTQGNAQNLALHGADIDNARLSLALADLPAFSPLPRDEKWLPAILRLPVLLREVLAAELAHGNEVTSIQCADWPQPGSVMVFVRDAFFSDHTLTRPQLVLNHMNDPHYWKTDIHQIVDGVLHAIAH